MAVVPLGASERKSGETRSFFMPDFSDTKEAVAERLADEAESARIAGLESVTTLGEPPTYVAILAKIACIEAIEKNNYGYQPVYFAEKFPIFPDNTTPTLPYPALIKLHNGEIKARNILQAITSAEEVVDEILRIKEGKIIRPGTLVLGREALYAYEYYRSLLEKR